ncbi:chitosanase [Bradyrhizobium sp. UFLA05-109]
MTIKLPSGPARGVDVVARAVNDLMPDQMAVLSAAGGGAAPHASQPIRRYFVKLSDLIDVHFLERAQPIGWRYLVLGPNPLAVADLKEETGGEAGFDSLIRGGFASRLAEAAEYAAQRYEANPIEYEVRVLEIPSIYMSALWLHGPKDIFIPLTDGSAKKSLPPREDPGFILRAVSAAATKRKQSKEEDSMTDPDIHALQQAIEALMKAAVQLNETSRQLSQIKPSTPAAAAAAGGEGATAMQLNADQRLICERVINCFETGSIQGDYSDITIFHDGPGMIRQITYGRAQTTEYSHLQELVKMYVDAGGQFANDLRPYIEKIGVIALVDDANFKNLLHRAGAQDPIMRKTQDVFFDRAYFQHALNWAQTNGFSRALSMLVIYDSQIQSGGILSLLRARFPEPIPARGGNEQTWIQQYVNVRNDWLANNANPIVRSTTYRTRDLAREIARGNWDLAITPISANGVPVDARPLAAGAALAGGLPLGVPYIGQAGVSFGGDDPAAPLPGEVDDLTEGSYLANFGESSVMDLAPLAGGPAAAPRLTLDMNRIWAFLKSCETSNPRVTYGLGKKVPFLGAVPGRDFTAVDCSGFVREALRLATNPVIAFPDGSVNQHDWIRAHGFAKSSPAEATHSDGLVRIAFLRPQDTLSHIGHVLLISGAKTIESHGGGVGPDSRAWTATGFQASTFVYVLALDNTSVAGGAAAGLANAGALVPAVQTGPRFWGRSG